MTIMVDWEIKKRVEYGDLGIFPFDEKFIQPNSIDVRLGSSFRTLSNYYDRPIDPYLAETMVSPNDHTVVQDKFIIYPNQFVLGATYEKIRLPKDIVGQLTGKSSLARLGLMIHVTAGFIDAGFSDPAASITLELKNLGMRPIILRAGMPIGQLVLTKTEPCLVPYNKKKNAKYNNQEDAAPSAYYLNKPE